jgi:colanic acid/amylovoran/stewartan biosynthesis glycosyltransferase WcaL/AmsK/CpsK
MFAHGGFAPHLAIVPSNPEEAVTSTQRALITHPLHKNFNILIATESFPNFLQSYVLNSVDDILHRGGDVTIAAYQQMGSRYPARVDQLGLLQRTRYFPLDSPLGILKGVRPYLLPFTGPGRKAYSGLRTLLANRNWHPRSLRQFAKAIVEAPLLSGTRFDLVHAHNLIPAYEFLMVARVLKIPFVTTFHGMPTIGGSGRLSDRKASQLFQLGDAFLANTHFAQQQLEALGCPAEKIHVIPQGLRIEDFPFRPKVYSKTDPIVLLTVARLSVDKGHRYCLEAVNRLRETIPNLEYRIVGNGKARKELEETVRQMRLENHVRFTGSLVDDDLRVEYEKAHILLLASVNDPSGQYLTETQGVVIQEAQASGTLVIATKTGGIPECIDDGRSAFLVQERDSPALAQKICWVVDHHELWPTWQQEARVWVEKHFSLENIGQRIWDLYDGLLKSRPPNAI